MQYALQFAPVFIKSGAEKIHIGNSCFGQLFNIRVFPQSGGNTARHNIPPVHIRGFAYAQRINIIFLPTAACRKFCFSRADACGKNVNKHFVLSSGKSVKAEFIGDKHIFRLGKKNPVNKDICKSIYSVKIQKHVGIGFLFQIKFGKITDMGVLVILRGKNIGAEI